jgi:adenine-specific DNA methylase
MMYPKRLIEVDLPIKRISAHARREKSIRHGHISTLHIWWARRPLAACRAVICAALWPDPADPLCPQAFRDKAGEEMRRLAAHFASTKTGLEELAADLQNNLKGPSAAKRKAAEDDAKQRCDEWQAFHKQKEWDDLATRRALLSFIAWGAGWEQSTMPTFLEAARHLTQAAHEALGGAPGTRPLVVDPFAGGGAIPLEALRVGADAFASDLNPVAVLLNKVVLEYIPKYGQRLADEVRKWGQWIKEQAEKELAEFYPKDPDGATPIAYLWARTIRCEGPGCGAEVPLMRSLWLARKGSRSVALRIVPHPRAKRVDFEIIEKTKADDVGGGTVARGSATCPCCGFTTPVASVRVQFKARKGGTADARLFAVVTTRPDQQGRFYRLPAKRDLAAVAAAAEELERRKKAHRGPLSLVPDETISLDELRRISVPLYGMECWGDLFSPRQQLSLTSLVSQVQSLAERESESELQRIAVRTCLALAVDRQVDATSSLSRWHVTRELITGMFGRQALGMVWDFAEVNPLCDASGSFAGAVEWVSKVCEANAAAMERPGHVDRSDAGKHLLPDDAADALVTDPPYYDAVPYAHLSDLFYVWLRRSLGRVYPSLLQANLVDKAEEIVVDRPHSLSASKKDVAFYEAGLKRAFAEGRRIVKPDGVCVVVFASKTTTSWEAVLQAVVDAGWPDAGRAAPGGRRPRPDARGVPGTPRAGRTGRAGQAAPGPAAEGGGLPGRKDPRRLRLAVQPVDQEEGDLRLGHLPVRPGAQRRALARTAGDGDILLHLAMFLE